MRAALEPACPASSARPAGTRAAGRRSRRERGVALFVAPNFAIGAVLMMRFADEAARYFAAGRDRRAAPRDEARRAVRHGEGDGRSACAASAPIHSVRLPGLVAHQEVIFGGEGQMLTIRHDTSSREAFVPGVLLALERLPALPPGLTTGLEAPRARLAGGLDEPGLCRRAALPAPPPNPPTRTRHTRVTDA